MNAWVLGFLPITIFIGFCFDLVYSTAVKITADEYFRNITVPYPSYFHNKLRFLIDAEGEHYVNPRIIKVKLSLYTTALCPGCQIFIRKQVFPVFMKIPKFIQLDLIPYGNSKHYTDSTGHINFTCQHGDPERIGNMYLACVTHILQDKRPKQMLNYYKCISECMSFAIEQDVRYCARKTYVNYDVLETCVKTDGPALLAHYGERTHALKGRTFVPTVVVDDKFVFEDQDEINIDLFRYLCKKFKGQKPASCEDRLAQEQKTKEHNYVMRSNIKAPQADYYRRDYPGDKNVTNDKKKKGRNPNRQKDDGFKTTTKAGGKKKKNTGNKKGTGTGGKKGTVIGGKKGMVTGGKKGKFLDEKKDNTYVGKKRDEFTWNLTNVFTGDNKYKKNRDKKNKFNRNKKDGFIGDKQDTFTGNKKDKFTGDKKDKFTGNKKDKFTGNKKDKFTGNKKDKFTGDKKDKFTGDEK